VNHKYFFKSKKFLSVDAKPAKCCRKMVIFPAMAILLKKHEKLIPLNYCAPVSPKLSGQAFNPQIIGTSTK